MEHPNNRNLLYGIPLHVWYALHAAASVDNAWNREPRHLCDLLDVVLGEPEAVSDTIPHFNRTQLH